MKPNFKVIRKWGQRALILLGICIFLYQIYFASVGLIENSDQGGSVVNLNNLLGALLMYFLAYGCQFSAWGIILSSFGYKLDWRELPWNYLVPFLGRYIPGTIWGYLGRNEWLLQKKGIAHSTSNAVSIVEMIIGGSSVFVVCAFNLAFTGANILFSLLCLLVAAFPILLLFATTRHVSNLGKLGHHLQRIVNLSLIQNLSLKKLGGSLIYFVLGWVFTGQAMLFILTASDNSYANLVYLPTSATIVSISWLLGVLAFGLPSGIGVREASFAYLTMTLLEVPYPLAVFGAVVLRFLALSSELIWLVVGFVIIGAGRKRQ